MNILFKSNGQSLCRVDSNTVAANSANYLVSVFELDESWSDYTVTAVFQKDGLAYHVILSDYRCLVPSEVLSEGWFSVSLIGIKDAENENIYRGTSEQVLVEVVGGPELEGENTVSPTATEMEQALGYLSEAKSAAERALETAEAVENGATFVPFVSVDGTLSWSNDKGLDNPESVNLMGPKGEAGKDGVSFKPYSTLSAVESDVANCTVDQLYVFWMGDDGEVWNYSDNKSVTLLNCDLYRVRMNSSGVYSVGSLGSLKGADGAGCTEEDKAEMVRSVLSALPTWEGGSY